MKKVCVIGLGYVGLPTAILVAQSGLQVVGVDTDADKIEKINKQIPVTDEAEVIQNLNEVYGTHNFKVTTVYEPADYFLVAVPTHFCKQRKKADLSHVTSAAMSISAVIKKGDTVILESTVPVGTTLSFGQVIEKESGLQLGHDFFLAHCPERTLPGNLFQELKVNDRVIGGVDEVSVQKAAEFYKYFVSGDLYLTNAQTAEMVKLIENSNRDVNIAFTHQVAAIAEKEGLNPYEVVELANKHPQISLLKPTCGVGGHCIAVDPWFLVDSFPEETHLLRAARETNDEREIQVFTAIKQTIMRWKKETGRACNVVILGLTYKADVDDLRESPALNIARSVVKLPDAVVQVCDPHISREKLSHLLQDSIISLVEGVQTADLIIALVEHSQFKALDKRLLQDKKVLDFCGLFYESRQESIEQEQFFWPASESKTAYRAGLVSVAYQKAEIQEETS